MQETQMSELTISDIIKAAKAFVVTDECLEQLKIRMESREKEFAEKSKAQYPSKEFMERTYTL